MAERPAAKPPGVVIDIRTGGKRDEQGKPTLTAQNDLDEWHGGLPYVKTGDDTWTIHKAWSKKSAPYIFQEFEVELVSNILNYTFQSHLSFYDGGDYACFRAHRFVPFGESGDDDIGVAWRRHSTGKQVMVECNPAKCALFQQYKTGGYDQELNDKYMKVYPHLKILGKINKKGVQLYATCKPANFFVCRLITPDGDYAHDETALAMLSTHGDVTHKKIKYGLEELCNNTGGNLSGLRVLLRYAPFKPTSKRGSKPKSAWEVVPLHGSKLEQETAKAELRRRKVDYTDMPAEKIGNALAKVHEETSLQMWVDADYGKQADRQALEDEIHKRRVKTHWIDPKTVFLVNQDPTVKALAARLKISYPKLVSFPMTYGEDVFGCVGAMVEAAVKNRVPVKDGEGKPVKDKDGEVATVSSPIFVQDILDASPFAAAFETPKAIEATSSKSDEVEPEPKEDEPKEAEFVEIKDERTDEELEDATKGKVAPPEEQPTIFQE